MKVKRIVLSLVFGFFCLVAMAAPKQRYTLVIDAGHGGKDAGACANKAKEKDINLSVALAFGRYVERNCPDVRVIYTRKTDVFIPLHQRADIANKNKADVFISIHTNALPGKKPKQVTGMETYTMGMRRSDEKLSAAKRENEVILIEKDYRQHYSGYDPRSPESMIIFEFMNEKNMLESVELAQMIQQNVSRTAHRPNKGVRQDAFLVLRETSMPACLVELGYITTASDAAALTNKSNVDKMGLGLYQAFVAYKKKRTGTGGPVITPTPDEVIEQPKTELEPKPKAEAKLNPEVKVEQPIVPEVKKLEPNPVAVDTAVAVPEEPVAETSVPEKTTVEAPVVAVADEGPVFKVQFLVSRDKLKAGDARLKGLKNVDCYQEGGLNKYTVGASTNYNEIYRLRKSILDKFPQAFIIAFKGDTKVDAAKAYQEFKNKSAKK